MIRHLVFQNSGNDEDAKDLFQDAVIALFEMSVKPAFKLKSKLSTLLYSIARNLWMKQLRGRKYTTALKDSEKFISIDEEQYNAEKEERILKIEENIATLGEPCKGLLTGFYYLRLSMSDLSKQYDYSTADHAKAQKYKCLQRLKKMAIQWT